MIFFLCLWFSLLHLSLMNLISIWSTLMFNNRFYLNLNLNFLCSFKKNTVEVRAEDNFWTVFGEQHIALTVRTLHGEHKLMWDELLTWYFCYMHCCLRYSFIVRILNRSIVIFSASHHSQCWGHERWRDSNQSKAAQKWDKWCNNWGRMWCIKQHEYKIIYFIEVSFFIRI